MDSTLKIVRGAFCRNERVAYGGLGGILAVGTRPTDV
jgi:hypothetical protein